jgi:hypothetical protein
MRRIGWGQGAMDARMLGVGMGLADGFLCMLVMLLTAVASLCVVGGLV